MNPKSSDLVGTIKVSFPTTIDGETQGRLIAYGSFTLRSSGPMSFKSIHRAISSNGFVDLEPKGFPAIRLCCPASMCAGNSSPNSIDSQMKSLRMILISLSVWAILLFGLLLGAPVLASFVALHSLALIVCLVISSCLLITLLACCVSGKTAPPSSST